MSKGKVVIIGSGLGGLSCGVILAKNGYQVTVLEQGVQIGGCLQCFTRGGAKFETGMHFIGSAAPGQVLSKLLSYLELNKDIELSPLDRDGYEIISIGGRKFKYATSKERFIETLAGAFPSQRENLERYYSLVEAVARASKLHSFKSEEGEGDISVTTEYQLRSINSVLDEVITDPLLAQVLMGNLPLYAAQKDKTPFATHAFIMDFYNQSAFRIVGGSDNIAFSLKRTIERYGGEVLTKHKVVKILCDESKATGVLCATGEQFDADYVVSDAHPAVTLDLVESHLIRPIFRKRIKSIPQSIGCFTVYLDFKEDTVPYMNSNYYGYNASPWECEDYDEESWPKGFLYMHMCHKKNPEFARAGVILSYMKMADVEKFRGTKVGRRGAEYEEFKKKKAQKLIKSVEEHFPGLSASLRSYYTSTPLTYEDYTGTPEGGMYGIAKDASLGPAGRIPHKTRIPNLFFAGQNVNSHGMLGVLVGTIVTCSEFLGSSEIYDQISKS